MYKCKEMNINPYELYNLLYNGEEIEFDLTCNGDSACFKQHKNFTISSLVDFKRRVSYN